MPDNSQPATTCQSLSERDRQPDTSPTPAPPQGIAESIRAEARRLLGERVDVVIAYARAWSPTVATPCFITHPADIDRLIFDEHCVHNLARYLVGSEGYLTSPFVPQDKRPRVAIVATPVVMRTLAGLIQEHQFARGDLVVLGISDGTATGIEPDVVVGQIAPESAKQRQIEADLHALAALSPAERRAWWDAQFAKCVRCYACRQVCPFCYCEQCIADKNLPQWIDRSPSTVNNRDWITIRSFHLIGRCVTCGECERACPMDIPLNLINTHLAQAAHEIYGYVAGTNVELPPALLSLRGDGSQRSDG